MMRKRWSGPYCWSGLWRYSLSFSLATCAFAACAINLGGAARAAGTLEIGAILPLTGGAASLGTASRNGIELARSEYNASRSTAEPELGVISEDDRAEPAASVSALQKLIAANGIRIVIGPLSSGSTLAVAPVAERNRVVIVSPGASAASVSNAGDYIFRVELSEALGARAEAELGYQRLKYRRLGILSVRNEYGVGTVQIFRRRFTELGGNIVADESFLPGTTDFRTALQKIKTTSPDAIFVVFQDQDMIVNILKERAELGVTAAVYTTPVFDDPDNLRVLGRLAENVIYAYYGTFDANSAGNGRFSQAYQRRFNDRPTYFAALGYDAARVAIQALRTSGFDQNRVKDNLYKIHNFPGVTGNISFDRNGDVVKPVTLKTVRGGRFVAY